MFYDRFIQLCKENGVSPAVVARTLGLENSITVWKHGSIPKNENLQKLADYFGVSVGYLVGENNGKDQTSNTMMKDRKESIISAGIVPCRNCGKLMWKDSDNTIEDADFTEVITFLMDVHKNMAPFIINDIVHDPAFAIMHFEICAFACNCGNMTFALHIYTQFESESEKQNIFLEDIL